jgi:hypothetical protein
MQRWPVGQSVAVVHSSSPEHVAAHDDEAPVIPSLLPQQTWPLPQSIGPVQASAAPVHAAAVEHISIIGGVTQQISPALHMRPGPQLGPVPPPSVCPASVLPSAPPSFGLPLLPPLLLPLVLLDPLLPPDPLPLLVDPLLPPLLLPPLVLPPLLPSLPPSFAAVVDESPPHAVPTAIAAPSETARTT